MVKYRNDVKSVYFCVLCMCHISVKFEDIDFIFCSYTYLSIIAIEHTIRFLCENFDF